MKNDYEKIFLFLIVNDTAGYDVHFLLFSVSLQNIRELFILYFSF
jgi:hypothetical protein